MNEQPFVRNLFAPVPPALFQPLTAPSHRLCAEDRTQGLVFVEEKADVEAVLSVITAADQEERAQLIREMKSVARQPTRETVLRLKSWSDHPNSLPLRFYLPKS